uniref:thioredoxin family protein n=1 Tax=Sphingomonas sp. TaxID=28214 RepID=UPI0025D846A0
GRPVFVYFTADWCLTCKVNERIAIERPEVAAAFAKGKVATLVGDWTHSDPVIGRFLNEQGRSGVPLYLFYRPGAARPQVLPQVLVPATLTALTS